MAELASLACYAALVRVLLRLGSVTVPFRALFSLTVIGIAMINSIPGGQAISTIYWYEQLRRYSVRRPVAAFVLLVSTLVGIATLVLLTASGLAAGGRGFASQARYPVLAVAAAIIIGAVLGRRQTAPDAGQSYLYTITFDTSTLTAGQHAISAAVTDQAGNIASASPVTITTGTITYLPVLNYHEINPPGGYSIYDETPAEADAQLSYLKTNGYQSVTLEQYQQWLGGANIGVAKPVLITVDDGIKDEQAWDPILQKYGFTAVLFVVTGFADNLTPGDADPNNMTWANIQALVATGRWQVAFHAGQYGHGDSYADKPPARITLGTGVTESFPTTCPYFYSCLGTIRTITGTGSTRTTTTTTETPAQAEVRITSEVTAGMTEINTKIPTASMVSWALPFNDAGQWTNLYNDPSGTLQGWLPGFMASKFPVIFTQTNPVTYALASGTVGALNGFNRRYRFEVHTDTTITQFAAALADPGFAR